MPSLYLEAGAISTGPALAFSRLDCQRPAAADGELSIASDQYAKKPPASIKIKMRDGTAVHVTAPGSWQRTATTQAHRIPKSENPAGRERGFRKSDVGASQQRDPTEYTRQAAQGDLLGLVIPNIDKSEYIEKGSEDYSLSRMSRLRQLIFNHTSSQPSP